MLAQNTYYKRYRKQTAIAATKTQAEAVSQAKDCLVEVERCLEQTPLPPLTARTGQAAPSLPCSQAVEQRLEQIFGDLAQRAALGLTAQRLLEKQRRMAKQGGVIMAGRDIGTVVLPDADLKIYLEATVEERACRRHREILERGEEADYEKVLSAMRRRDKIDSEREAAPLRPADDAIIIDTTELSIAEVVVKVEELI